MCGIFALVGASETPAVAELVQRSMQLLQHRGPDASAVKRCREGVYLAHTRLALVGIATGQQPLQAGNTTLCVNGEIYNYQALAQVCRLQHPLRTDCEIILHLHRRQSPSKWLPQLRGMFAFVLYNAKTQSWLVARDHLGIVPLYMGWMPDSTLVVASELKALEHICVRTQPFPPGHYWSSSLPAPQRWYTPSWRRHPGNNPPQLPRLRELLQETVTMHTMGEMKWGVLLSGGLDSSIIAALAARPGLPSFAVGLADSPDLEAAASVASALGLTHHSLTFTVEEGLAALTDVIYHLETFDATTIRASVPMYLLGRYIREQGLKMVLSGEGSDEMFAGYLYFHRAPSAQALYQETVAKLEQLHLYDCLRANKSMAAHGVETRVPFLDPQVVEWAMAVHPRHKLVSTERPMEKHLLREAFAEILPDHWAWRRKEQFSDGVGQGWIAALQAHAERTVTDQQLRQAEQVYPLKTPRTKEQLLYRQLFATHFPSEDAARAVPLEDSVACSTATAAAWDARFVLDPSGHSVDTNMLGVTTNAVPPLSSRKGSAVRPAAGAVPHRRRSRHSSTKKVQRTKE